MQADMTAMVEAMTAFQRQAREQLEACAAELTVAGLGFDDDDRAAIAAAAAAPPTDSPVEASSEDAAAAEDLASRTAQAVYPREGFAANEPRLEPAFDVSLPLYALASRAIGAAGKDAALVARVTAALGIDEVRWVRASAAWSARIRSDIVLATFYGQLYVQAGLVDVKRRVSSRAARAHLTCPSCGRSAQREGVCESCGARIDQTATAGVGIKASAAGVAVGAGGSLHIGVRDGETRECPHCGASVTVAKGKTCPYCNQSLVIEQLTMTKLEVSAGGSVTITGKLVIGREQLDDTLLAAVLKGDKVRVYKLMAKGQLSLALSDAKHRSALHHVVLAQRHDMIDFVVTEGAPIDGQTQKGETALHLAVEGGHREAVAALVRLGASPTLETKRGISSRALAERKGDRAIIALLGGRSG